MEIFKGSKHALIDNPVKDVVFVRKEEKIIGETPWTYDKIKRYEIKVKGIEGTLAEDYVIGNICIKHC